MNTKVNEVRAQKVKIRTITNGDELVRRIRELERYLAKMKVAWAGSDAEFIEWSERIVQGVLSSTAKHVFIQLEA